MSLEWSNLGKIVFRRTYSRKDTGTQETLQDAALRVIAGNVKGKGVPEAEQKELLRLLTSNKAGPAGRGWWFSGAPAHDRIGGAALNNCYYFNASDWGHYVIAQDLLMLGGGVGMSVEHRFVSKLPKVRKDVVIQHKLTKDADFIVPDSREGWNELTRRVLESYFDTGRSFNYSTVCVRGAGEPIKGFGGTASGPIDLIKMVEDFSNILNPRSGKYVRPIDAGDILCAIGQMVVAGNVRRSALILIGDPFDKDFLKAKRWDLGLLPRYRSKANFSVVCDDIEEDLPPLFWKTYEIGEPFGLVNRKNIRKYGRMGELKPDSAEGVNPCAEATLENGEPCNLTEIALPNLANRQEFFSTGRLMHRWAKRVTMEKYHHPITQAVVSRNRRTGAGITGCLASGLFIPDTLDEAYKQIQIEDEEYSRQLNIPRSIRTTVVKPSGTRSKVMDCMGYEGIHAAYSRYMIQRVQFSASDPLVPMLKEAGHYIEPLYQLDGTYDHNTVVVDFYQQAPDGRPVADEDWGTFKQLDVLLMAQKHWADQAVSVTVYYKREELAKLKEFLRENWQYMKTISFLCHSDHGFRQAPKEAITREQFERLSKRVKPLQLDDIPEGDLVEGIECQGGACPIR